jgi:hypothetical protein
MGEKALEGQSTGDRKVSAVAEEWELEGESDRVGLIFETIRLYVAPEKLALKEVKAQRCI